MERTAYQTQRWRDLPRDYCLVDHLLGHAAGPCQGLIAHHHVDPSDPDSRTVQCCNRHHQHLHAVLRGLSSAREWRRCTHQHRYEHARRDCERRLNSVST